MPNCVRVASRNCRHIASILVPHAIGGHTAEIISLIATLPFSRYRICTFVLADTDSTSEARVKAATVRSSKGGVASVTKRRKLVTRTQLRRYRLLPMQNFCAFQGVVR